ncbi:class I SAM-dependent methyltransferase [Mycolicibacterium thermoresistibile]
MTMSEAQRHWENRYQEKDQMWSGRVNLRLSEVAGQLSPGRALDLGCGEGADAAWLAERGWQVTAVDISQTALNRAAGEASARGLSIDFQRHELPDTFPDGQFELVSAQFFHSEVELDRVHTLQRGAEAVAPGGVLLIVDHGSAPPWAGDHVHDFEFPSPQQVLESLELQEDRWEQLRAEPLERETVGPKGQHAVLVDNVILLRRR